MDANSNSLFVFPETGATVRVATIREAPWFVAADVIRALGMSVDKGAGKYLSALGPSERGTASPGIFGGSGMSNAVILTESGLYKVILRAHPDRNDRVRKFQDWVTRDVLPAIRKDGAYVRGEELLKPGAVETLDMNDLDALRDRIESLMQRLIACLCRNQLIRSTTESRRSDCAQLSRGHLVSPSTEDPTTRLRIDGRISEPLFSSV